MFRDLFPRSLRQWLGPLLTCAVAAGLLAVVVIASGIVDLAASVPHPAGWADLLHTAFKRSVAFHSDGEAVPADLDSPAMVIKGASYYTRACAHCHGGPGLGQNPVALMMRPRPQYLPQAVRDFTPAELHYIVLHGVKYSAMPAWPAQSRPDEVWPVVAFLRALPRMNFATYRAMVESPAAGTTMGDAARFAFTDPGKLTTYALHAPDQPSDNEHLYARPVAGFDPFAQDVDPRTTCAACHGTDGAGRAAGSQAGAFPNLTIQTPTYLRDALTAFASGKRHSAYMQTIATQLTQAQIDALATYYGSMAAKPAANPPGDDHLRQEGAQIVAYGIKAGGIGACSSCHGITRDIGDAIPRLQGQSARYLIDQMRAFSQGGRGSSATINPMGKISHRLNDREIAATAAYYAATPPSAKAVPTARAEAAR